MTVIRGSQALANDKPNSGDADPLQDHQPNWQVRMCFQNLASLVLPPSLLNIKRLDYPWTIRDDSANNALNRPQHFRIHAAS